MIRSLRLAILVATTLVIMAPGASRAGEPVDPNLGDTLLGTVGSVRYASETGAYDLVSGYGDATAGCGGPRWHLLGGGAASGGSASGAWLAFTRPDDYLDADTRPDDGFLGGGFGPGGASITTYSICRRDGDVAYRVEAVEDQASGLRSGSVACGASRWHVTSGSVAISTSDSWVGSSFPIDGGDPGTVRDDGWKGTALDTVDGLGGFYIHAVCAAGVELRYVRGTSVTVSAGSTVLAKATCGADAHVVGGGARVDGPVNRERLVTSAPYDGPDADAIPDDGWKVRVHNISGQDKQVTPFAICLS